MYPRHVPRIIMALEQPKTFNELSTSMNIPPSTLSRGLKVLRESGALLVRPLSTEEESKGSGMWKYELNKKGKTLLKHAKSLAREEDSFWSKLETA